MPPDAVASSTNSLATEGLATEGLAFAGSVRCEQLAPGGWRLTGHVRGAALIVDLFAAGATAQALQSLAAQQLHDIVLSRVTATAGDWSLVLAGRSVALPQLRVFVHRDVVAQASAAIPPRRVPWRKRLFWSTLLLLLRTSPGRRWVQQRYGSH